MALDFETTSLVCAGVQAAVAAIVILAGVSSRSHAGMGPFQASFALAATVLMLGAVPFLPTAARGIVGSLLVLITPLQVDGMLSFTGVGTWRGWRGANVAAAGLFLIAAIGLGRVGIVGTGAIAIDAVMIAVEGAIGVAALSIAARPFLVPALGLLCACFALDIIVNAALAGLLISGLSLTGIAEAPLAAAALVATVILLLKGFGIILAGFQRTEAELLALSEDLKHQAATDPLTKARNRRSFYDQGGAMVSLARRHDRPLTALMVDIDRFKSINDTHGHGAGDTVLIAVADTLTRMLRTSDLIGRVGGEEFAILLVETSQRAAEFTAERLRRGIAALHATSPSFSSLTISIGLAPLTTDVSDLDTLLQAADQALYRAKREGRNRWVAAA